MMWKVGNKKAVRRLSDRSLASNRTRNLIAAGAIMLTTVLFTTLFTIGMGLLRSVEEQTMRQSGGIAHGTFKDIDREAYERLKDTGLAKDMTVNISCAYDVDNPEFLKRHLELWYRQEDTLDWYFIRLAGGHFPEKADEIMMDTGSLSLLGITPREGARITLSMNTSPDQEIFERTFVLSGWFEPDPAMNVGFGLVSEAYLEEHSEELHRAAERENGSVGKIRADVMFHNSGNIQGKLDQMIEQAGYSTDDASPDYIPSNANWAYLSESMGESDPVAIAGGAVILLIIILAGYLIIYNIFQLSVIRDIQFYGLLKTIGTTGRQIKKMIRRQAFLLSLLGIPLGLLGGFFLGCMLLPVIFDVSVYGAQGVSISANPVIFIGAALFSLFTVGISTRKPARIAARVSPVEAAKFAGISTKKKEKKSSGGAKIWRMALSNLGRNKKQTVIVLFSMALAIVLVNGVFMITGSFDTDKYLERFVDTDYLIGHAEYFNYEYIGNDDEYAVSESMIQAVGQQPGFEEGGRILGYSNGLTVDAASYRVPEYFRQGSDGTLYVGDSQWPLDQNPYGNYFCMLYGLDDLILSRLDIWQGEDDPAVIKEKLSTGNYLLASVPVDDNGKVEEDRVMHQVGDKVTIRDKENQEVGTYEILSLIKEKYYPQTSRISWDFSYYTGADQFCGIAPSDMIMTYAFNVKDSEEENMDEFLQYYTEQVEPDMSYESKKSALSAFDDMTGMFVMVGMALSLIVGLIGILNFINSILTGMITRKKEFAMLQSIGMTKGQLRKMLLLEGLYYAVLAILLSFGITILLSVTALKSLSGLIWFISFRFSLRPMAAIVPILLLLGILIPLISEKSGRKQSIIDQLREE
ncbi:MAG: ABC transporter permease [Ruminococcus sp.]